MAAKTTYPLGLPPSKKEPVFLANRKIPALLSAPTTTKPPEDGPRLVPVPWDPTYYVVYGIEPPPIGGAFPLVIGTTLGLEIDVTWPASNPPPPPGSYTLQFIAMDGTNQVFAKTQGPDLILNIQDALDWQMFAYFRPADTSGLNVGDILSCWVQATSGINVWMLADFSVRITGPGGGDLQSQRLKLKRYSLQP